MGMDLLIKDEVDKVVLSGLRNTFSSFLFYDFLKGMKTIHQRDQLNRVAKDLPIYIFSGEEDPVGDYGKGLMNLYENYHTLGLKNVSYKLYPGGRHEILNEINKDEVIRDLIRWIDQ